MMTEERKNVEYTPTPEQARRYYVRGRENAREETGFFKRSDGKAWRAEFDRMIAKERGKAND